jgi:hypothetical protein
MEAVPAPEEDVEPDDEDTLTGLEAAPAVGTMVVSVEELERQTAAAPGDEPAGEEPDRRRRGTVIALVALIAFLVVLAVLLLWAASSGGLARVP